MLGIGALGPACCIERVIYVDNDDVLTHRGGADGHLPYLHGVSEHPCWCGNGGCRRLFCNADDEQKEGGTKQQKLRQG